MKTAVVYRSRSGNTKKVADAIAKAAGVTASTAKDALEDTVDLLFVGGALYAGNIDGHLVKFLEGLSPGKVKRVAVFSTAAGPNSCHARVKELLEGKGIAVEDKYFHCPGKFLFSNKGRPNEDDLMEAASFAKSMIG